MDEHNPQPESLEQLATSLMTALVKPIAAEVSRLKADVACHRMLLTMLMSQTPELTQQCLQWIDDAARLAQTMPKEGHANADQAQAQEQASAALERIGRLLAQRAAAHRGSTPC